MTRPVLIVLAAILALVGYAFGRFGTPAKTEWKTEYVDRVQVRRLVQVARQVDVKWKTVTVTKPSGEVVSTTEAESHETTKATQNEKIDSIAKVTESKISTSAAQNWHLAAHFGLNLKSPVNSAGAVQPIFGAVVSRRILGPLWADAFAYTNGMLGLGVGIQF